MAIHVDFRLNGPGLDNVHVVLCRETLSPNGDLESAFFDRADTIRRHDGAGFPTAFQQALATPETEIVAVIRNPSLVLDAALPDRIASAIATLPNDMNWAIAGAGGLGPGERRHLALYASASPALPDPSGPHPLIDVMPDLYLVDAAFARKTMADIPVDLDTALEPVLVASGYLQGRVSVYSPMLAAGIDGALLPRDFDLLRAEMNGALGGAMVGQTVETLSGPVTIESTPQPPSEKPRLPFAACIRSAILDQATPTSLSIVTRTRFERPHLLHRLLASISRARRDEIETEVVLSSDTPALECNAHLEDLRAQFRNLEIRLSCNESDGPSRVRNMLAGIAAARNDYVAIVDDDDYLDLFALENLRTAFFAGNRPLIVTSSEVHEERWETELGDRAVLAHSRQVNTYPAEGWRRMFHGVNRLPICAPIMPREWLCARLDSFRFVHDLSEDYAMFLLLLTDPSLPPIHEVPETFCHISLRGTENSVTMPDRRPWVRDICGHLSALTQNMRIASPGYWRMLSAAGGQHGNPALTNGIADLQRSLARRETELRITQRENAHLRAQLAHQEPVG